MGAVPDFWRAEVWHPLTVHFPIVLILFSSVAYIIALLGEKRRESWVFVARLCLYISVPAAWLAIFTGDLAYREVSRTLCDPTVLKDHEIASYCVSIIISVAAGLQLIADLDLIKKYSNLIRLAVLLLLFTSSGFLIYSGHLGAQLVYQQGAGTFSPSEDCREFD